MLGAVHRNIETNGDYITVLCTYLVHCAIRTTNIAVLCTYKKTIYLLLQSITEPTFTVENDSLPLKTK
jgi:hypothetical protein